MIKITTTLLSILIMALLLDSCSNTGQFQKQKFTNLKIATAPNTSEVPPIITANELEQKDLKAITQHYTSKNDSPQNKTYKPEYQSVKEVLEVFDVEASNFEYPEQEITQTYDSHKVAAPKNETNNSEEKPSVANQYATAGIILLCITPVLILLFPSLALLSFIAAFICGAIAKNEIKNAPPNTYSNTTAANLAFWIPLSVTLLVIGLIAFIIIGFTWLGWTVDFGF